AMIPSAMQARPNPDPYHRRMSSLSQTPDGARLHGPQQAQPPIPGQALPPRALQTQPAVPPGAPGTQMRPPQPPQQSQPKTTPVPAPSPSSGQMQVQAQAQQQLQERLGNTPAIAAFRVLQPAKALLEKTWSTAIASVQQELAVIQTEHIKSTHEQKRLADM